MPQGVVEIASCDRRTGTESAVYLNEAIFGVVPGMIVRERWCRGSEGEVAWMLAGIHRREKKELTGKSKVSASGTGAGDSLVSDAVRGGSLAGRPSTPMG